MNSSMKTVPAGIPSTVISKKTIGRLAMSLWLGFVDVIVVPVDPPENDVVEKAV